MILSAQWREVEKLIDEQKYEAAYDMLQSMRNALAGNAAEEFEATKILVWQAELRAGLGAFEQSAELLRTTPWPQGFLARSLRGMAYGKALLAYGREYSYQIRKRTKIISENALSIGEMSSDQILAAAMQCFHRVFQVRPEFDRTGAEALGKVFVPGTYPQGIRSLLRDFISYQAAELLADQTHWDPAESNELFRLGLVRLLGEKPAGDAFTLDDAGLHPLIRLCAVLDDLESWHRTEGRRESALEARLERIRRLLSAFRGDDYERERASLEEHLKEVLHQHSDLPWSALGNYLLALTMKKRGENVGARAVAQQSIERAAGSIGAKLCAELIADIEAPDFHLEGMLIDGINKRTYRLSHKNIQRIYFRAIPFDLERHISSTRDYNVFPAHKEWKLVLGAVDPKHCFQWFLDLAPTPDYRMHWTYFSPPINRPGMFVLVASLDPDFTAKEGNRVVACNLLVSDMVLLTNTTTEGIIEAMVVSGEHGAPIEGADVELYRGDWNRGHSRVDSERSNAQGSVTFSGARDKGSHFIVARKNNQLCADPNFLHVYRPQVQPRVTDVLIYSDRSIYRPEQKLYIKVVAYRGREDKSRFDLLVNEKLTVELRDANDEVVAQSALRTGDFGSASVEFTIPSGRLLGTWYIRTSLGGSSEIKVEEYKRPTFEMSFLPSKKPARLNAPVEVLGEAKYFFGLPVTQGIVRFRVERSVEITGWRAWFLPPAKPQRVASGETALQQDGTFAISFTPEADPSKLRPETTHRYTIHAELTDEGGETAKASKTIRVGTCDVQVSISHDGQFIPENTSFTLRVQRTDKNGSPRKGHGRWRLVSVQQPQVGGGPADIPEPEPDDMPSSWILLPGDRYPARWNARYMPMAQMATFPEGQKLGAGDLLHDEGGLGQLQLPPLAPGLYRICYETQDDAGAKYENSKEILVVGQSTPIGVPTLLMAQHTHAQAGSTLKVFVSSGTYDQVMFLDMIQAGERLHRWFLKPGDRELFEFPIDNSHRGGFTLQLSAVRDYQLMTLRESIFVPWDDKELKISWGTFRNKLYPGQKETWTLSLQGPDGKTLNKRAAEVLAYMYDRSLEVFATHLPRAISSLYPDRRQASPLRASLQSQTGYAFMGDYLRRRRESVPVPEADRFVIFERYGIGGLGRRMYSFGAPGGAPPPPAMGAPPPAPRAMAPAPQAPPGMRAPEPAAAEEMAELAMDQTGAAMLSEAPEEAAAPVQMRSNFAETAFFFPHLVTEADGSVTFSFEMPDSVTSWSVWVHAITKDLKGASEKREVKTSKDLMVRPYVPRFFREGDKAELRVMVQNAGDTPLSGHLTLDILDAETDSSLLSAFGTGDPRRNFEVAPGLSQTLSFPIAVPARVGPIAVRVEARAGQQSDGELRPLPVLPSRMHLAQSRFVTLRDRQRREMIFEDMRKDDDPSLIHEQLVMTVDAQLIFTVLKALPYLIDYPYECCEQVLNRFVSASIISGVYAEAPALAAMGKAFSQQRESVWEKWHEDDPNRRMSLEETPWLRESKGGDSIYPVIKLLDPKVAEKHRDKSLKKLVKVQLSSGGFPWFPGGPPSPFVTLYLLEGMSRALEFGVKVPPELIRKAFSYMTGHFRSDILPRMRKHEISPETITYLLYVLSGYRDESLTSGAFSRAEFSEMLDYSFANWKKHSPMLKSQLALVLDRNDRGADARLVFSSVLDSAKTEEDKGTFWAPEGLSWLWYNDTIEGHTQALLTTQELFPDSPLKDGLVLWLLLNKKLNHWKSTKATAGVIYALVKYMRREKTLGIREHARVIVGNNAWDLVFDPDRYEGKRQMMIEGERVNAQQHHRVIVEKDTPGFMFASATWHFSTEKLPEEGRGDFFTLQRKYFVCDKSGKDIVLRPLSEGAPVKVGDEVEVQLALSAKHSAEYVHLNDPRPAGFEPEDKTSRYFWEMIGHYREIRDSGTNFFFDSLPTGEYTLKYRIRAAMAGTFRSHPATVQPMYAPEFVAYSSGAVIGIGA